MSHHRLLPNRRLFRSLISLILLIPMLLPSNQAQHSASAARGLAPLAPLPKPEDIACQGWERDSVLVSFRDTATDETEYRIERSVAGAAFSQIAVKSPNAQGKYDAYKDTGVDVSVQTTRYRVRSYRSGDNSFSPYSEICSNRRVYDPGDFRFFYGLRGTGEDCPTISGREVCLTNLNNGDGVNQFIALQNEAMVGSGAAFARNGFNISATTPPSGLDKIPINVIWCDGGGCAGGSSMGLSPMLLETPFDLSSRTGDPVAWIVALHELFHFQQFKYGGLQDPDGGWVIEGQARSSQDKYCIGADRATAKCFDDIATGYAGYVPEVKGYLGNTNWPVNRQSYAAALFWTYVTEKYGTTNASDTSEIGLNLFSEFWKESKANPNRDGIAILNSTLATLGHSARFRDIWKDFAVANYAKDILGSGVPAKYRYADVSQTGGNYGPPAFRLSRNLAVGEGVIDTDETVHPWGAVYYELRPASGVPVIDIKITQDSSTPVYYTILGIRDNNLVYEYNTESRHLARTVVNSNFDKVIVIVAGLEHMANYRYSFNGTQPSLRIISPTTANKARVGDPSAPEKFLVMVEAVDGAGIPLEGIDLTQYNFRVGTVDVTPDKILTSATIQGQQWFLLRAPNQTASGLYDLRVGYSGILTATQTQAVNYVPRTDMDNVLIIDRSGSMSVLGKMDAAKSAARLFVDSWRTGDQIGVVSFNHAAAVPLELTPWTDAPSGGSRQQAFNAINGLTPTGATAIGDALRKGWNQLIDRGNAAHDWFLVLLSDGIEEGSVTETFDTLIDALGTASGKRPVVHSVAVGANADRIRMQTLASRTGGTYQYVSTPGAMMSMSGPLNPEIAGPAAVAASNNLALNMDARYRMIATKIAAQQQFYSLNGPVADDNPYNDLITIPVEGSAAELNLSLSWDNSTGSIYYITLRDPSDQIVQPFESDSRHRVWRVPTPASGNWTLSLGVYIVGAPEEAAAPEVEFMSPYLIQGAVESEVTLDAYLATPDAERKPAHPMRIVASLTDTGPLTGSNVIAYVERPNSSVWGLRLWDDGLHGDGAADDGVYSNLFTATGQVGSYNVTVNASGTSPLSGAFFRQELLSFHLEGEHGTLDTDGDGLPDDVEVVIGTDPVVPDNWGDPDNDGVPTGQEVDQGTDPFDPDTDDGGEADGTDGDPLDPSDDSNIEPTWGVAYPGNAEVFLKYVLRPEYVYVDLFRADGIDEPYTLLTQLNPGTGVYTDTALVNETTYCYTVRATDGDGHQTPVSSPSCATPRTDPWEPEGWVKINDGAPVTLVPDVTLNLWASDAVDPHLVLPGDEILVPPADSASGVTEMIISNSPDFSGAAWEPYATTKPWTLGQNSGLATVYVKYKDAAGNESETKVATIWVGSGPGLGGALYFPLVITK